MIEHFLYKVICTMLVWVSSSSSCVCLFATLWMCSPQGSSVHEILQTRILEWVAMPFSRGSSQPGIKPMPLSHLHWQAGSLPLAPTGKSLILLYRSLYWFGTVWYLTKYIYRWIDRELDIDIWSDWLVCFLYLPLIFYW